MRSDALINSICVRSVRESDGDVCVLEPETRIDIRSDLIISLEDIFDVDIHEIIERVNMLLYETLDLKKSGQEQPFVLQYNATWLTEEEP